MCDNKQGSCKNNKIDLQIRKVWEWMKERWEREREREKSSSSKTHEDYDFNDAVLKYINQMLMEEDMEGKDYMLQGSEVLEAAEKSLYELLGEKYPPSPDNVQPYYVDQNHESSEEYYALNHSDSSCSTSNNNFVIHGWDCDLVQYESSFLKYCSSVHIWAIL